MRRLKKWTIAGTSLALFVMLAGCDTSGNQMTSGVSPTTNVPNATTASQSISLGSVQQQNTTSPQRTSSATAFQQSFRNYGSVHEVFLNHDVGFQVENLGGGASNFEYQFSKTTNGGTTWTKLSQQRFSDVRGVSFIDQSTGYLLNNSPAYGITPDLFVTHDGGSHWSEQKLPIPSAYSSYYRQSNTPVFLTQNIGVIPVYGMNGNGTNHFLYLLVTTDGGAHWQAATDDEADGLRWTVKNQTLTVNFGKQSLTIQDLYGVWHISFQSHS